MLLDVIRAHILVNHAAFADVFPLYHSFTLFAYFHLLLTLFKIEIC